MRRFSSFVFRFSVLAALAASPARPTDYPRGISESNTTSDSIGRLAGFGRGDSEGGYCSPANVSGLVFWVKADAITGLSDGQSVSTWSDLSGNGHDATASGSLKPTYKVNILNSMPVVRFSSSPTNRMQTASFTLNQPSTVFMVSDQPDSNTPRSHIDGLSCNTRRFFFDYNSTKMVVYAGVYLNGAVTVNPTLFSVMDGIFNGGSSLNSYNGTVATGNAGSSTASGVTLGDLCSNAFAGDVAEVVIYSSALSAADRQGIEGYLAWRWGLEPSLPSSHPYYSAPPCEMASDSIARRASLGRSDSETNTASDAIARLAVYGRGESESNPASDAIARLASFGRGDSENNVASDSIARSAGRFASPYESLSTSDTLARLAIYGRGDSETNIASDAIARLAGFGRGDSETNIASDAIARLARFGRGDSETNIASDAIARLGVFWRGETESDTTYDAVRFFVVLARHRGLVPGRVKTGTAPVH